MITYNNDGPFSSFTVSSRTHEVKNQGKPAPFPAESSIYDAIFCVKSHKVASSQSGFEGFS